MITVHKTTLDGVHHRLSLTMAPKPKEKIHGCSSPLEHATNVFEASFIDIYLDFFHPNGLSYMSHGADDAFLKTRGVGGEFGYTSVDSRKVLCIHDPFPGVAIYQLDGTFHIEGSELEARTRQCTSHLHVRHGVIHSLLVLAVHPTPRIFRTLRKAKTAGIPITSADARTSAHRPRARAYHAPHPYPAHLPHRVDVRTLDIPNTTAPPHHSCGRPPEAHVLFRHSLARTSRMIGTSSASPAPVGPIFRATSLHPWLLLPSMAPAFVTRARAPPTPGNGNHPLLKKHKNGAETRPTPATGTRKYNPRNTRGEKKHID
ncbi:hypothetical protein B0H14DRAFT_3868993 [Mycena olivaceomarginata]|nr:hypothetical protein B0H14DRAFT_3868993 [Mycena olivaceomarginata]